MFGRPGQISGLILRLMQCVFAAASIKLMSSASRFSSCTTFSFLILVMGMEFVWSFILLCMDVLTLRFRRALIYAPIHFIIICIGDWVVGFVCLGAACASAAVVDFLHKDDICYWRFLPCTMYGVSIALAFVACFFLAISAKVMFCLVASMSY